MADTSEKNQNQNMNDKNKIVNDSMENIKENTETNNEQSSVMDNNEEDTKNNTDNVNITGIVWTGNNLSGVQADDMLTATTSGTVTTNDDGTLKIDNLNTKITVNRGENTIDVTQAQPESSDSITTGGSRKSSGRKLKHMKKSLKQKGKKVRKTMKRSMSKKHIK